LYNSNHTGLIGNYKILKKIIITKIEEEKKEKENIYKSK